MLILYVIICILFYNIIKTKKIQENYITNPDNINNTLYYINQSFDQNIITKNTLENVKCSKPNSITLNEVYTNILKKVSDIFKKLNIKFFLSSGTLLGYFREGKFIEYDYDIDIGIYKEDFNNNIIRELKKNGFIYYRLLGSYKNGLELSFYYPDTIIGKRAKIDIFLHYKENNNKHIYWVSYYGKNKKYRLKYRISNFTLKKVKFMDVDCWVPDPTLKYIEEHYGMDWMIPKKPGRYGDYHYSRSPVSIVK